MPEKTETKKKSKLTINIDDYGISENSDKEIVSLLEAGCAQSVSIFFTSPRIKEAARLIEPLKNVIDIGAHLDLTFGEYRGKKRLETFNYDQLSDICLDSVAPADIAAEFEAQIKLSYSMGFEITHIDNHRPDIYFKPQLFAEVLRLAKKYDVFVRTPFTASFTDKLEKYAALFNVEQSQLRYIAVELEKIADSADIKKLDHLEMPFFCREPLDSFKNTIPHLLPGHSEILCHAGHQRPEFNEDGVGLNWALTANIYEENDVQLSRRNAE